MGFLVTHFLPAGAIYLFHTTQFFYSLGIIVFVFSVCERTGQKAHLPTLLVIYALSVVVLGVSVSITPDVGPRLIIVNTSYGAMYIVCFATLLMARRRDAADYAIIAIVAIQAIDFLVRPNLTLMFERTIPADQYRDSVYYSLIGLVLGVKSVATAMVLIGATIAEWTRAVRETSEADPLTGLHNRAAFEEAMRTVVPKAHAESRPLSLVVADIDHFKQVNDIWGHQSGDKAISSFGRLISEMIRGCDTAGRVGGEEFCIAVWNCPNEPAERLAERIRQAFAQLDHEGLSNDIRLTASFGVATAQNGESYKDLFARADAYLYEAKFNGRNRVENAERVKSLEPAVEQKIVPKAEDENAALQG